MEDSMDVYDVAKVCHEVNKAYCESIGDMSQKYQRSKDYIFKQVVESLKGFVK